MIKFKIHFKEYSDSIDFPNMVVLEGKEYEINENYLSIFETKYTINGLHVVNMDHVKWISLEEEGEEDATE